MTSEANPDRRNALTAMAGTASAGLACAGRPTGDSSPEPTPPRFPAEAGRHIAGEIVHIDSINRRGGLRLDGDQARYFTGPPHWFALLPHAPVWHLGARAELRDLPLGCHVHGHFIKPPKGEESTIPPLPGEKMSFTIAENHAAILEDDFSYYQRRGQAWKVVSINAEKEKIDLEPVLIKPPAGAGNLPGAGGAGQLVKHGMNKPQTFDIDSRSEVWSGNLLAGVSAIKPGMTVQFNLAWAQGWGQGEFRVGKIWIDAESREAAGERQRQRHIQFERERWTAGWIDHVDHNDYGGGIVTITLFEVDKQILDDLWADRGERIAVAVAEKTRRTWFHRSDRKFAKLVEWKNLENPPLGSSPVRLRLHFTELLAGYSTGGYVRVKAERWKFVTVPPEERLTSRADQERGARMVLPW